MSKIKKPYRFGKISLPNNIFYAPLAGCSDYPFRQMSARYQPGLMFCEMVKMDALVRNDPNTFHMLDYCAAMRPIGAQLCGSKPELAGPAAKIIEDLGFDTIDFNCGCPVDKVTKDGSGSGMMKNPELIGEILTNIVAAVNIPVTVKIRSGWDESQINAPEITQIAEQAGATAITIHGRTREQAYRGFANWDHIKACVDVANTIQVIGNGDVFDPLAAEKMFQTTGCDAILVSRGTMGTPWIVEDIIRYLEGLPPIDRSLETCREALLDHFNYALAYQSPRRAVIDMRRVGCWYFKKSSGTKSFRNLICRANDVEEVRRLISDFTLQEEDLLDGEMACVEND